MALDDLDLTSEDVGPRIRVLFEAAKEADEFEFGCTLLRVRGIEAVGWDPFVETGSLVEDLMGLVAGPLRVHAKVRLGLLLYSHLIEVETIYSMLANLARVVDGERYVMNPFADITPKDRKGQAQFLPTTRMVRELRRMLESIGHGSVAELFDWFFVPALRNSFAHASYTLHEKVFRSQSDRFGVGGILTAEFDLDLVAEIVNRALAFYGEFYEEYVSQRRLPGEQGRPRENRRR